ncbi:hypothetical protein GF323_04625 [Candidatus Woesearchaeota archaeon]|nr:hypothetical protein [Candidatus Woesearchaeota archaeon]
MTNITHEVWDFINKYPEIKKNLTNEIINIRALANFIIKKENLDASMHSVISAIRRYDKEKIKHFENQAGDILKDSKISTKSRIVSIIMSREFDFLEEIMPQIYASIDVSKGELLRIAQGRRAIEIFIDHSKKSDILDIIPDRKIYKITENLGEINIHLDERRGDCLGLVPTITNELALTGINIVEIIGCMPEIIIIVNERNISKAHDTLLRFFYGD